MLVSSIMVDHGVLCADKTIKYAPAKAVLKLRIGDEILLNEGDFARVAEACLRHRLPSAA